MISPDNIKAIIGLGNPGPRFSHTRHNVGFMVVDALADKCQSSFKQQGPMEIATAIIDERPVLLVKPQTFMNKSGDVLAALKQRGITPQETLVVHDELEKSFGKVSYKTTGSHRGHNGLRSLFERAGSQNLPRVGVGIGRPESRDPDTVSSYVLGSFDKDPQELQQCINQAVTFILKLLSK